ncbi:MULTISPECIES: hypothetical protein [Methylobacterium]|uniref:hypothetical protein n=1 Tax=Methylobacterium TaxID=407 RepID=UPI0013ED41DA|nr:hypothetical protein [Methylobacterium sp. DB0501]
MIVALSVLALLMLIGGLAAMVQGIPFVRLEVGWTMVIAGTVGASAGAVLLGITAAVARLGRIERALAGAAVAQRPIPDRPAPAPVLAEPAPPESGTAPIRALRSEPVMGSAPGSVQGSILPPVPFPAATPPAPRPAEPTGLDGGPAASELRLTRAEDADPPAGPQDPAHHEPVHREPLHAEPVHQDPAHRELEPLAQEHHVREPHAPIEERRFEAGAPHDEPAPPPVSQAAEPSPPPPPEPAPPPPPPEELLPEEPPGKTVIGTYDSGGNTYTMYADGTIDAETPAGRFHFASIDELKAFRSAGGEGAARSA